MLGYGIYSAAKNKFQWQEAAIVIILANVADMDFLFGFIGGAPNKYHHQFTHSIFMAALVAIALAFFWSKQKAPRFPTLFALFFVAYFSHVLVDFFTVDTSLPYGEQLLWPFTNKYYISPVAFFMNVQKANTSAEFIPSLFSKHNLLMVFSEIGIFGTLLIVIKLKRGSLLAASESADSEK